MLSSAGLLPGLAQTSAVQQMTLAIALPAQQQSLLASPAMRSALDDAFASMQTKGLAEAIMAVRPETSGVNCANTPMAVKVPAIDEAFSQGSLVDVDSVFANPDLAPGADWNIWDPTPAVRLDDDAVWSLEAGEQAADDRS